ncbi:oryzin precursor [Myriangium duriaei CBS 260.36]|uniref:Oryzin n=1 Tax=Myriangium duriaei CBS 260.36 TaxID=1168546 RepID=A0A9P4MJM9_9PEZI|nr:oryzin precursor [Myriangium duriaei CBS 260.36]
MLAALLLCSSTLGSSFGPPEQGLDQSDKYIVTLKPGVDVLQHLALVRHIHARNQKHKPHNGIYHGITYHYSISDFQAYAGHFHPDAVDQIKSIEDVEDIETDKIFTLDSIMKQDEPPYALNLISHRGLGQDHKGYSYDKSAGQGTYAYVIDSGVEVDHQDFEGRAFHGHTVDPNMPEGDDVGHGTFVAGIIGSKTFGVAKKCELISVKTFEKRAAHASTIMMGYDWAVKDILLSKRERNSVINMSLGGPLHKSFNRAIDKAFGMGITTVVSAGNNNEDVANHSPASAAGAISVAATDAYRVRAPFSNWGSVSLFATGQRVSSTWPTETNDANRTFSGTSYAAPYVAGIALYLQGISCFSNSNSLKRTILQLATPKVVGDSKGSTNLFAYNNGGSRLGVRGPCLGG